MNKNIQMINDVAKGLLELKDEVVFVGGATIELYLDMNIVEEIRPTEDVDCIIEIAAAGYQELSEKLLARNFSPDSSKGAPICRWKYCGITIDIMPTDEEIIGFTNQWYSKGISSKVQYTLPTNEKIYILPLGYFIACKIVAFSNRGKDDPLFSKDLEDIVTLIDSAKNFEGEVNKMTSEIRKYIKIQLKLLMKDRILEEAVIAFLPENDSEYYKRFKNRLNII